jgi:hypothetical protein
MTAQTLETLLFEGKRYGMYCEPFRDYCRHAKLVLRLTAPDTGLWRGYEGEWEIADGRFYLVGITGEGEVLNMEAFRSGRLALRRQLKQGLITPQENGHRLKALEESCYEDITLSLERLFGTSDKAFAEWYTGTLFVPCGRMLEYVHAAYASRFEREMRIHIEKGLVTGVSYHAGT